MDERPNLKILWPNNNSATSEVKHYLLHFAPLNPSSPTLLHLPFNYTQNDNINSTWWGPHSTGHRVSHRGHAQRRTRDAISQLWGWKNYGCAYCWNKGPAYWLPDSCGAVHGGWFVWWGGRSICMARNWKLRPGNIYCVDIGDIVDAGPPPVFVHRIQTNEILLGMAGHLCRSPRHHEITRNASPIAFSVFLQTEKK